jgi:hypothetical protein
MRRPDPSGRFLPPERSPLLPLAVAGLLFLACPLVPAVAETSPLSLGLRLEERLAGGASRRYPVALEAGDVLRAVVTEEGIDVVVRLLAPNGNEVVHVDGPTHPKEDEELVAIAPQGGIYQLEVAADDRTKPPGCYVLRIEDLRPADDRDRRRAEAVRVTQKAVEEMRPPQGDASKRRELATRER